MFLIFIGVMILAGMILLITIEISLRWASLQKVKIAAQTASFDYASMVSKHYRHHLSLPDCEAKRCNLYKGDIIGTKNKSVEYVAASQKLLNLLSRSSGKDSKQVTDIRQFQCYQKPKKTGFLINKFAKPPECISFRNLHGPIMSLTWEFKEASYGKGVCCSNGSRDLKRFCTQLTVKGRMDSPLLKGFSFLYKNPFVSDGGFSIQIRNVIDEDGFIFYEEVPKSGCGNHSVSGYSAEFSPNEDSTDLNEKQFNKKEKHNAKSSQSESLSEIKIKEDNGLTDYAISLLVPLSFLVLLILALLLWSQRK